jgi:hypothetical protein
MRTEGMNAPEEKKSKTDSAGDIRRERGPKPTSASQEIEEGGEAEDQEGNLPPAMPPGA